MLRGPDETSMVLEKWDKMPNFLLSEGDADVEWEKTPGDAPDQGNATVGSDGGEEAGARGEGTGRVGGRDGETGGGGGGDGTGGGEMHDQPHAGARAAVSAEVSARAAAESRRRNRYLQTSADHRGTPC